MCYASNFASVIQLFLSCVAECGQVVNGFLSWLGVFLQLVKVLIISFTFAKQHILSLLALTHICTVEHLNDGFTPRFEIRLTTVVESWVRFFFSAVISKGEAHEVYKVFNVAMVSCAKYKLPEVCHYHLLRLQTSNTIKRSLKEVSSSDILISPLFHHISFLSKFSWFELHCG